MCACVCESVRCHHVDMCDLDCCIGMRMLWQQRVFILFSASLVSVQTVINTIIHGCHVTGRTEGIQIKERVMEGEIEIEKKATATPGSTYLKRN